MSDAGVPALSDMVVIITGGGRGIGRATVDLLLARGTRVAVLECDTVADLADAPNMFVIQGDAGNREDMLAVARAVKDRWARVDTIVTHAMAAAYRPTPELRDEDLDAVFAVGVKQIVWAAQATGEVMDQERSGSIVTLASPVALVAVPYAAAYTAAKGAVAALTRQMAVELGPKIRVNAVLPGAVDTDGAASIGDNERHQRRMANTPLRRRAHPDEIARTIAFLASDEASYVTGAILVADGGITIDGH